MRAFRRVVAGVVAAALLAGCVTVNVLRANPGSYPNYREMAVAQMELFTLATNAPRDLERHLNICAIDVYLGYFTTYELERMDQYARGELHMSDDELRRFDADVWNRIGGEEEEIMGKMKQKCPDVVEDAASYKKANS